MTPAQRAALPQVFATLPERVLHGGAEGADEEFHDWIRAADGDRTFIVGHPKPFGTVAIEIFPASYVRWEFWRRSEYGSIWGIHPKGSAIVHFHEDDPLIRNRLIAARCDALLATPAEPDEVLRSGTWSTIRYARKEGKPITLILPSGEIREERR
jgi:hypothetical protein